MGWCMVQKDRLQDHQILLPEAGKLVHNETHCETVEAENNKTGASCNGTRSLCSAPSTLEAMPKSVHTLPRKRADLGSLMGWVSSAQLGENEPDRRSATTKLWTKHNKILWWSKNTKKPAEEPRWRQSKLIQQDAGSAQDVQDGDRATSGNSMLL